MENASVCLICGLSIPGSLTSRRLGPDEPAVLVRCCCPPVEDMNHSLSQAWRISKAFRAADSLEDDQSPSLTSLPEPQGVSHLESEISLSPFLSRLIFSRGQPDKETSFVERGSICMIARGGLAVRCSVRERVYHGSRVAVSSLKIRRFSIAIAPGMTLSEADEFECDFPEHVIAGYQVDQGYAVSVTERRFLLGGWICRSRYYIPEGRYACEFEYLGPGLPGNRERLRMIGIIHSDFAMHHSYKPFLDSVTLSGLRNVAKPVKDLRTPTLRNACYRAKADGELSWIFRVGSLWYICRSDYRLTIVGYKLCTSLSKFIPLSTVIRAEQMPDGTCVLIDLLALNGKLEPVDRPFDSYKKLFLCSDLPSGLVVRKDWDTVEEAREDADTATYPSDGIIAVDRLTSSTYRIKPPTLDMICKSGSLLVTRGKSDHRIVCPAEIGMREGCIYECKVSLGDRGEITVDSYIKRTDKVVPNSSKVYFHVLSVLRPDGGDDIALIDAVSSYSFSVRKSLYRWVHNKGHLKGLIIDVGSGRLQSLSIMLAIPDLSYLLCDPHIDITAAHGIIDIVNATDLEGASLVDLLQCMSRGRPRFAYYKGTLESLVAVPGLVTLVRRMRCPLIYSFSLSYLSDVFNRLSYSGVRQAGCCYIYDDINEAGELVNSGGIVMKRSSTNEGMAMVSFGSKVKFREPMVKASSFNCSFHCRATSLPSTPSDIEPSVLEVVRHIGMFMSF